MTTQAQPIETHAVHSRRLIIHAEDQLALGDRIQASEKAWGAVAHALKIVADNRGARYETHADAGRLARRLAQDEQDPRIFDLYVVANHLHNNFYKDVEDLDFIRDAIERVKVLLGILRSIEPDL